MLRKKLFDITTHAQKRMDERNIPHPYEMGLKIANGKAMKQIKESCKKEGLKRDYIYWTQFINRARYVYVCVQKDVNHYIVITCFKYEKISKDETQN